MAAYVTKTRTGCNGKLPWVIQTRVEECPLAVHLQVGDKGVPMGHRTPAGIGMQIHACQAEGRRDERRRGFTVRAESLAVEQQFGVEFPRSPGADHLANGRLVDPEQRSYGTEIGCKIEDRADVKITVG